MNIQKGCAIWLAGFALLAAGTLRADPHAPEIPVTTESAELIDTPDLPDPPLSEKLPEGSPTHDGYTSEAERIKAGEEAATDPRAEAPDEILAPPRILPPGEAPTDPDAPAVTRSFAGLTYVASGRRETPDVSLARSPNRVLQATNGALRLFDTTGTVRATRFMDTFFGLTGIAVGTTDPKVYYDRLATNPRLIIAVVGLGTPRGLHLAISRKPDPDTLNTADWCRYRLAHPSIAPQVFVDYPGLGAGPEHLIVTTNHFERTGAGGGLVRLIEKAAYANSVNCPVAPAVTSIFVATGLESLAVGLRTLQPVQYGTSPGTVGGLTTLGFLVSALDYGTRAYRIFSLQRNSNGQLVLPLPFSEVTSAKRYFQPPPARQTSETANSLDSGDGRVLQAVGYGNSVWFTQTTGCNNSGTSGVNESCIRVLRAEITPRPGAPGVTLAQQFNLGAGFGVFLWMPSIAVTLNGSIALAYHHGSANAPMGVAMAVRPAAGSQFVTLQIDAGSCTKAGGVRRSGDYLGAQADPGGTTVWLAGERLSTQEGTCQWTSIIKEVLP